MILVQWGPLFDADVLGLRTDETNFVTSKVH